MAPLGYSREHFGFRIIRLLLFVSCAIAYTPLSDDTLRNLPRPQDSEFDIHTGSILSPILIPRVPGTPGSTKVLNHFVNFFQKSLPEWEIGFQNSTFTTPVHGDRQVPFVNFIATRDPPWSTPGDVGRLALVAHYDSKYTPEGFIGATDSAAPCAMIMHAVRSIDAAITKKWEAMQASGVDLDFDEHVGIQVLFLDGEEAFQSWTETDSIYGARALASYWDTTYHPPASRFKTFLDSIELFVLLDLLGSPDDLTIPSWFKLTHPQYQYIANAEQRLRKLGLFKSAAGRTWLPDKDKKHDEGFYMQMYMQDDHIPFIAKGVEVLHLIPQRFPSVWHHIEDDGEHLDMPSVEDWAVLTAAFAAEYMDLEGHFDAPKAQKRSQDQAQKFDASVSSCGVCYNKQACPGPVAATRNFCNVHTQPQMDIIHNGRELLRFASPRQDHYRDGLVRIPHANRTIHIDSRPCNAEELESHCSLFALPAVDQSRWTHIRLQTARLHEDFSARQPQPSAIPHIVLTPGVSKFWKEPLRRPLPAPAAESATALELAFVAIVQGAGGSAVKKVIVAGEYPHIATALFNEAVNGFSIVFVGACLRSELEKARDFGPASLNVVWRKVRSLEELLELRVRSVRLGDGERVVVGILC